MCSFCQLHNSVEDVRWYLKCEMNYSRVFFCVNSCILHACFRVCSVWFCESCIFIIYNANIERVNSYLETKWFSFVNVRASIYNLYNQKKAHVSKWLQSIDIRHKLISRNQPEQCIVSNYEHIIDFITNNCTCAQARTYIIDTWIIHRIKITIIAGGTQIITKKR